MELGRAPRDELFFDSATRCAKLIMWDDYWIAHIVRYLPNTIYLRPFTPFPQCTRTGIEEFSVISDEKKEGALATRHPRRHQRGVMS